MINTQTARSTLLVALLLVSILPMATAGAVTAPTDRDADLAIQQPHYIDGDVRQTSRNGTTVYRVSGAEITVRPRNFNPDNVVDYGVASQGSSRLRYDERFDVFVFTPNQTGTYELYWSVEKEVRVNQTDNSSNTSDTEVVTQQQRYRATIRVEGGLNLNHVQAGSMESTRQKASQWEELNATVQELRHTGFLVNLGLRDPPSTKGVVQGMVNAYKTIHAPLQMLTGNFTTVVFIAGTTLGGWLFVLVLVGPLVAALAYAYYRYNVKDSIEADEGRLAKRLAKAEYQRAKEKLANWRFTDITDDDHYAEGLQAEGRNPLQAFSNREGKLRDRNLFHAILQAMAECGYVAVFDERAALDGGGDGALEIEAAHVVHRDDIGEGDDVETMDLRVDSPDHELLDALDPNQPEILEFDLLGAEFERSEVNPTPVDTYDLEEMLETTEYDLRMFGDAKTAAQYHVKFLRDIREHPITDDRGNVDELRYWLEQNLDTANLLRDRFELPVELRVKTWERAIEEYDAGAAAEETLDDVREGGYA